MNDLIALAETIAARLKARRESVAIAESSTGGLISAALLALPGASAYFLGGAVAYKPARPARLAIATVIRPATLVLRLLAPSSGLLRLRPAAPSGSPTCMPLQLPPLGFWPTLYRSDRGLLSACLVAIRRKADVRRPSDFVRV